ncbi:deaminase [Aurantiacibacter spongiae]|uniref:CMP/dCMP-type deaminase domain-containing protein n=1 Tax=Aurantiacibacter spongiae TaxID=2488860 RepID=A0A3N5CYE1_9SPHN|nr:hypothetical protein EG799_04550 [Aurantiacibacter spongiae]
MVTFRNQTEADLHYLAEALGARSQTDDPKAKAFPQSGVGVVIAKGEVELARSANVLPPALAARFRHDMRGISDEERYHVIEHAERAAIYQALQKGIDLSGATLYGTRFPCSDCARAMLWAGIARAVFPSGFAGEDRWVVSQRAALHMLRHAGVTVRYLSPSPA